VIISEPILAITKVYSRLIRLLQISNVNTDPALLLPSLHVHMGSLLKGSKKLTTKLKKFLEPLDPMTVLDTATDLASLLASSQGVNLTPMPATACSIYILSLEAVALKPIPDLMQIAELLGVRFGSAGAGASKWCITDRYNTFLPSILEWKTGLPWTDASISTPSPSKLRKAPRIEVAKCLRDVVIFRAKLNVNHLAGKFAPLEGPTFHCDQKPAADLDVGRVLSPLKRSLEEPEKSFVKKQRVDLGCSGESENSRSAADTKRWLQSLSKVERLLTKAPEPRLTRLEAIRAKCEGEGRDVTDEELFEHGELEGLMRSEQEVEILRKVRGWEGTSHDSSQTRQDALMDMDDPHVKGALASKGTPAFGAGEEEEVVEEWRPLSPTSMSLSFFQEDFVDW
jgi:transcription factor IIIB subunit 2